MTRVRPHYTMNTCIKSQYMAKTGTNENKEENSVNDYMIRQDAIARYEGLIKEADTHRQLRGVGARRRLRLDSLASLGLVLAVAIGRVLN